MKAEKREISVVGLGYIGLPTAVVLAQAGHLVKGYDVNPSVRESLSEGKIHIVENHLQEAFSAVQQSGNLRITSELEPSQIYILCVPTPFLEGEVKRADLSYVRSAAKLNDFLGVVKGTEAYSQKETCMVSTANNKPYEDVIVGQVTQVVDKNKEGLDSLSFSLHFIPVQEA